MKVKKLLTVLLFATMLTACAGNNGENNNKPDDNTPVQPGGDDDQGGEQQKTLTGISVSGQFKTDYFVGDQVLDLEGLVVTAHYSDNTDVAVATGYEVEEPDFSTPGQKNVKVTYQGFNASFTINVVDVVVSGIRITSNPTKVDYVEGEQIDLTGLAVSAIYNNGSDVPLNADEYTTNASSIDMSVAGPKEITVSYQGFEQKFTITVAIPDLDRIEITTEPTKLAYTAGQSISLDGMVVTAYFANGTEKVLGDTEYTTNIADLDMRVVGTKEVTVSYGGKSDSFNITVSAPTDWDSDVKALFTNNVYGVNIPFFYDYELGLGDLQWAAEGGQVYAVGGSIRSSSSAFSTIAGLFDTASGWTKVREISGTTYSYEFKINVEVEGETRLVDVVFGPYNTTDSKYARSGNFLMTINDPYYYNWAATGLGAALKTYFNATDEIPALPMGLAANAIMRKTDASYAMKLMQNNAEVIEVWFDAPETYLETFAGAFDTAGWIVRSTSSKNDNFVAYSPNKNYKVNGSYDSKTYNQLVLKFTVPEELPQYLITGAGYFEVDPYKFSPSSGGGYYYSFKETLGDGETLADLIPDYYAKISDAELEFIAKQTEVKTGKTTSDEGEKISYAYRDYLSVKLGIEIEIFAYGILNTDESAFTSVYTQIIIDQYHEPPEYLVNVATLLSLDILKFSYSDGKFVGSFDFPSGVTDLAEGLASLTSILDADNTLNYRPTGDVGSGHLNDGSGRECKYVDYANDYSKIEFLVYDTTIQLRVGPYTPPPVNTLVSSIKTLTGYEVEWDDEEQVFFLQDVIPSSVTDNKEFASEIAEKLTGVVSLEFTILVDTGDKDDYIIIIYNEEGYVKINATSSTYSGYNVLEITAGIFDDQMPLIANLISAAMSVHIEEDSTQPGLYVGATFLNFGSGYTPADVAGAINYYIGANLTAAEVLGFKQTDYNEYANGYAVITYTAHIEIEEGVFEDWAVDLVITCDAEGEYDGILIQAYQYDPQA